MSWCTCWALRKHSCSLKTSSTVRCLTVERRRRGCAGPSGWQDKNAPFAGGGQIVEVAETGFGGATAGAVSRDSSTACAVPPRQWLPAQTAAQTAQAMATMGKLGGRLNMADAPRPSSTALRLIAVDVSMAKAGRGV